MYCICCGIEVDDKMSKCPRCGCFLDNIDPFKKVENKNEGFIFCPNCGNILSNRSGICKMCGASI